MYKPRPIEVAVDIPSGQMIFDDDLRFAYPVPEEKGSPQYADGPLWQKIITESYGEVGLFHGFVGNSCPSIHRYNGKLIIGNSSYDSDSWETLNDLPGESVGSVCTDLWWYSIADKVGFIQRMLTSGKSQAEVDKLTSHLGTLDVEPGRYILKHYHPYFGKPRIEHGRSEIFATLELSNRKIKPNKLPDEGVVTC